LRSFGCGEFIWKFLLGHGPYGSYRIDPKVGAPQADIFFQYKNALIRETAMDRAVKAEERKAKKEKRSIEPDRIDKLFQRYVAKLPYKAQGCRYHSFVVYFSNLVRLGWVEVTGKEEVSTFQDHYPLGQPRRYYRLTQAGVSAGDEAWANPHLALYSPRPGK